MRFTRTSVTATIEQAEADEVLSLEALVDAFAKKMKAKMRKKYFEGYEGWDETSWTREKIVAALKEHLDKGDPVDIATFAAFMWNREA